MKHRKPNLYLAICLSGSLYPTNLEAGVYKLATTFFLDYRQKLFASRVFGLKIEPKWGTMFQWNWDTNNWVANNQKARSELGWHPVFEFEDSFRRMVEWYSTHIEFPGRDYQSPAQIVENVRSLSKISNSL